MSSNVALVVLDSLRHDVWDSLDWVPGLRFSRAYAPSHWTIPTHASVFTGRYPSEIGVHGKSASLDCPKPVLAEQLASADYRTRFYSANTTVTFWDGWGRGFDKVVPFAQLDPLDEGLVDWSEFARRNPDGGMSQKAKAVLKCIRSDCSTVAAFRQGLCYFRRSRADGGTKSVIRRVNNTDFDTRFEFLVLNLMETHTPYHTPDDDGPVNVTIGDAFADNVTNPERVRGGYRRSVEYLAETYRELFDILEANFDYIITVGDHGEMLGEHEMWNHGYGLYPELVRVPLVLSGTDIPDGENTTLVSLLDLHKTIGDLAGVELDSRGRNLLSCLDDRPLLTEYHGFLPWHRDQFERKGVPEGVYDEHDSRLHGVVLPEGYAYETHANGLQTEDGVDLDRARTEIEKIRETIDERETGTAEPEIDEKTKQHLRELGYA